MRARSRRPQMVGPVGWATCRCPRTAANDRVKSRCTQERSGSVQSRDRVHHVSPHPNGWPELGPISRNFRTTNRALRPTGTRKHSARLDLLSLTPCLSSKLDDPSSGCLKAARVHKFCVVARSRSSAARPSRRRVSSLNDHSRSVRTRIVSSTRSNTKSDRVAQRLCFPHGEPAV